jgi:hypothetical protein
MGSFVLWVFLVFVVGDGDGGSSIWWVHLSCCCCESAAAAETTGQEFKFSPMAEYERRIASGDVHPGDKFQVCVCFFSALCPTNSCQSFGEEELLFWKPSYGNARNPLLIPTLNPKNPRSRDKFQVCFFFPFFVQQNLAQALQKKIVCCFWKPSYGN